MTVFNLSLAKHAAEAMGFDNLADDVSTILTQDTEYRLREIIQEAKKFMRHAHRPFLMSQDILSALALKNIEPIYGFHTSRPVRFKKALDRVFYLDDEELDFDKVLASPLPRVPVDASITAHWLAIDGVQPLIPQNPSPGERSSVGGKTTSDKVASLNVGPGGLVKDALSREFQLYYQKITEAVLGNNNDICNAALSSVRTDPGLQTLVPYFINFCQDNVTSSLRGKCVIGLIIPFLQSLLSNPHVFVEPYLHQVVPLLLTIILSKRQDSSSSLKDSLAIRDQAGSFLADLVLKYASAYPLLIARITKTLLVAIVDDSKPLVTKYGAVVGLALLGPSVISATLVPYAEHYSVKYFEPILGGDKTLDVDNRHDPQSRLVQCLMDAYAAAITSLLISPSVPSSAEISDRLNALGVDNISPVFKSAIQSQLS